ncbi:hypothetical protein D9M69_490200 [compost metagenome]
MVTREGRVQRTHGLPRFLSGDTGLSADDDAIRAHEVFDRGAFLEEFGVGDHGKVERRQATFLQLRGDAFPDPGASADRDGRLVHDDLRGDHVSPDIACGGQDIAQIGGAVFVWRGAHGDELDVAKADTGFDVAGEAQAAGRVVARDEFFQARFVDGDFAGVEHLDLGGVKIQAKDIVAELGQTGAGDQAYIATTDDGDLHVRSSREEEIDMKRRRLCAPLRLRMR